MTTIEQKPKTQSNTQSYSQQTGDESPVRQSQQQNSDDRKSADRGQSAQQEESSFTISADDFMML